jgi:peptidoglycan/xylan/chitin deacetylase (PgdA/CDA1 family)
MSTREVATGFVAGSRGALRSGSLARLGGLLTGFDFSPPGSPIHYHGNAPSAFVISVDFDIAGRPDRSEAHRSGTEAILSICERYGIPITWGICGFTASENRGLFDTILRSPIRKEIACHSYAHAAVRDWTPDRLRQDLAMWMDATGERAVPQTFIFPYNVEGNFEELRRLGFRAYRPLRRCITSPGRDHGLCRIPPVCRLGAVRNSLRVLRAYTDICVAYNSVMHVWTHPSDVSGKGFVANVLQPYMEYVGRRRDQGVLWPCILSDLIPLAE